MRLAGQRQCGAQDACDTMAQSYAYRHSCRAGPGRAGPDSSATPTAISSWPACAVPCRGVACRTGPGEMIEMRLVDWDLRAGARRSLVKLVCLSPSWPPSSEIMGARRRRRRSAGPTCGGLLAGDLAGGRAGGRGFARANDCRPQARISDSQKLTMRESNSFLAVRALSCHRRWR